MVSIHIQPIQMDQIINVLIQMGIIVNIHPHAILMDMDIWKVRVQAELNRGPH